jgi:UDP-galactopyranose mutase
MTPESSLNLDVVCLSHLRWNFVFQRPQHLMTRCARDRRVFFVEEPVYAVGNAPQLAVDASSAVTVVVPHLPSGMDTAGSISAQRALLDEFLRRECVNDFVLWYYTPMALRFTDHLKPAAIVYDCMDELSAFKGADSSITNWETELMRRASLVLTGGQSLFEAKRALHSNIYPIPSSVDVQHFARARQILDDPADQAAIPHPRLGFFGVIDERMDITLLEGIARARPDWHIILIGPVVKIDPASLPALPNLHCLGPKTYEELPHYVAGWDVATLPFARNKATRFISPTKTPEYMAAGKPIVSTSIRDVVRPYGHAGLVRIADEPREFVAACSAAMAEDPVARVTLGNAFLRQTSWDGTWSQISRLMDEVASPYDSRNADSADSAGIAAS